MLKDINHEFLTAIQAVMENKTTEQYLTEQANAHEELHKKILKDLHKHYPGMNINNSKHVAKNTYHDGSEFHRYESDIPVHDSVKHMFKSLKASTTITHYKDGGHHATLSYSYEHHNGGSNGHVVADHAFSAKSGKHFIRHNADGMTKEV